MIIAAVRMSGSEARRSNAVAVDALMPIWAWSAALAAIVCVGARIRAFVLAADRIEAWRKSIVAPARSLNASRMISDERDAVLLDAARKAGQAAVMQIIPTDADAPLGVIAPFPGEPSTVIVDAAFAAGIVAEPAGVRSVRRTFALPVAVAVPSTGAGWDADRDTAPVLAGLIAAAPSAGTLAAIVAAGLARAISTTRLGRRLLLSSLLLRHRFTSAEREGEHGEQATDQIAKHPASRPPGRKGPGQ